jgi:pSer/pThr/pTyr-binding forkhead associated (FHA) protein
MVQFNILSGRNAGNRSFARHFPFHIGRAAENGLQLEDDGVWDSHLILEFKKQTGFQLTTSAGALATINGEPAHEKILRNGDIITLGAVRLQFWLAAAQQRSLRLRESFNWALILIVTLAQFGLLYWLIR